MPNIRVRNNKLFASNACEFPQVYDSFPPSMLIKSVFVWACRKKGKKKKSVCGNACANEYTFCFFSFLCVHEMCRGVGGCWSL